eukprot:Nk52_evm94s226 gene=Nk52_evmTU94s226
MSSQMFQRWGRVGDCFLACAGGRGLRGVIQGCSRREKACLVNGLREDLMGRVHGQRTFGTYPVLSGKRKEYKTNGKIDLDALRLRLDLSMQEQKSFSERIPILQADKELGRVAKKLFSRVKFMRSVPDLKFLPEEEVPEFVLFGRSNVGKSSLMNALCGEEVAACSKKPGFTKMMNFFSIGEKFNIIDCPGYGKGSSPKWMKNVGQYCETRQGFRKAILLIDSSLNSVPDIDWFCIELFENSKVPYMLVLTKVDKCVADKKGSNLNIQNQLREHVKKSLYADRYIIETSCRGSTLGMDTLKEYFVRLAGAAY